MATTIKVIMAALVLSAGLPGVAAAQAAAPLTSREVVGNWTLRITPVAGRGVTVKSDDGAPPEMALTIAARANGGLSCTFDAEPADCRIRNGDLTVTWTDSGAAMIFTLTDRSRGGFNGGARIRARLIPFGSVSIGTVSMVRR